MHGVIRSTCWAAALVATAALAVGVSGAVGDTDSSTRAKDISCTVKLAAQRMPSATRPGIDFGQITCAGAFGFGMQYDTFTIAGTEGKGTAALKFKAYFDGGRANGTWALTFAGGPCDLNFKIKVTFDGGTRKYKDLKGGGTGSGDFTDVASTPNCSHATFKFKGKVTGA